MDKRAEIRAIKEGSTNFESPINDSYTYVRDDNTFTLSDSEYTMVREFLQFVRNRARGVFAANIITHQNRRHVMIEKTDKVKIDLPLVEDEN